MEYPLVSFIIVSYCQEDFIAHCLKGALEQDYPNLEIIISDDCSTDRTFEIINNIADNYKGPHRIRIHQNKRNLGFAMNVNCALGLSKGEFICWNAGDDIPLSSKASNLISPMLENEQIVAVESGVYTIDLKGKLADAWLDRVIDYDKLSIIEIIRNRYRIRSQSHAFRRIVLDRFGEFQPYMTNEGTPMAFREKVLGKIHHIAEPQTLYRIGSGTSTYSGQDVLKLSIEEPLKILNWHFTSLLQIQSDLDRVTGLIKESEITAIRQHLNHELELCQIRKEVIEHPWKFKALCRGLKHQSIAKRVFWDFLKRNSPKIFLKFLFKVSGTGSNTN